MNLSDGEKIIILMLSDLYEKLGIDGGMDPSFLRTAILDDQIWAIKWKFPGIPFSESNKPAHVKKVIDILSMWSVIEFSYNKFSDAEKTELEKMANPFGKDPKFQGFDGNNESDYISTARFFVDELDRFQEFKGRDLDCHYPSIEMHDRMLKVYNQVKGKSSLNHLALKDLTKILNAKKYPNSE